MALRRLPFESSAIFAPTSGGRSNGTFFATYVRTVFIYDKGNVREESIQHQFRSDVGAPRLYLAQQPASIDTDF